MLQQEEVCCVSLVPTSGWLLLGLTNSFSSKSLLFSRLQGRHVPKPPGKKQHQKRLQVITGFLQKILHDAAVYAEHARRTTAAHPHMGELVLSVASSTCRRKSSRCQLSRREKEHESSAPARPSILRKCFPNRLHTLKAIEGRAHGHRAEPTTQRPGVLWMRVIV